MDYSELKIPNHVAIIVDGNGRWAKERGMTRMQGHDAGFDNLVKLSKYIMSKGVKYLSYYVFSTENFKRDKIEVDHLMDLFVLMYKDKLREFQENNIKVVFSGRNEPLPEKVIKARDELVRETANNTRGIINFCMNYGGRAEILDAVKKIVAEGVDVSAWEEKDFANYLYQDLPDVDLMIRTSGELRLSNFLLWQVAYSEFLFVDKNWPDFSEEDLDNAIEIYQHRHRKFGAN